MKLFSRTLSIATSALLATMLTIGVAGGAHAAPISEPTGSTAQTAPPKASTRLAPTDRITQDQIDDLANALDRSDYEREAHTAEGKRLITYLLPNGLTITIDTSAIQPRLGGGWNDYGLYIDFNRSDQAILVSGGGAGLATALCLIPGVGPALCVVAVSVVAAATAALASTGLCKNVLRIHVQQLGAPLCV